jgi:hypothetical protein
MANKAARPRKPYVLLAIDRRELGRPILFVRKPPFFGRFLTASIDRAATYGPRQVQSAARKIEAPGYILVPEETDACRSLRPRPAPRPGTPTLPMGPRRIDGMVLPRAIGGAIMRRNTPRALEQIPADKLDAFHAWIYASLGRDGAGRLLRAVSSGLWPSSGALLSETARLSADQVALARSKAIELLDQLGGPLVVDGVAYRAEGGVLKASLPIGERA